MRAYREATQIEYTGGVGEGRPPRWQHLDLSPGNDGTALVHNPAEHRLRVRCPSRAGGEKERRYNPVRTAAKAASMMHSVAEHIPYIAAESAVVNNRAPESLLRRPIRARYRKPARPWFVGSCGPADGANFEAMGIALWIILLSWAAFVTTWAVMSFNTKRDVDGRRRWALWWVRLALIVIAFMIWRAALVPRAGHVRTGAIGSDLVTAIVSAGLCASGILLAIWARLHLGRNWSPAPAVKHDHELVTSGPYSRIRHPIYTGMLMAMLGSALLMPVWFIILLAFGAMFVRRVRTEERLMESQFPGRYPEYERRTWALLPFVW